MNLYKPTKTLNGFYEDEMKMLKFQSSFCDIYFYITFTGENKILEEFHVNQVLLLILFYWPDASGVTLMLMPEITY
jgi:hypothetical protein